MAATFCCCCCAPAGDEDLRRHPEKNFDIHQEKVGKYLTPPDQVTGSMGETSNATSVTRKSSAPPPKKVSALSSYGATSTSSRADSKGTTSVVRPANASPPSKPSRIQPAAAKPPPGAEGLDDSFDIPSGEEMEFASD